MKKTVILNESDLRRLVGKAVSRILNEYSSRNGSDVWNTQLPGQVRGGIGGRRRANKELARMSDSAMNDFNNPEEMEKNIKNGNQNKLWVKFYKDIIGEIQNVFPPASRTSGKNNMAISTFIGNLKKLPQLVYKVKDEYAIPYNEIYEGKFVDDYNKKADRFSKNIEKNRNNNLLSYTINNICRRIANMYNSEQWIEAQKAIMAEVQQNKLNAEEFKDFYDTLNKIKENANWFLEHTFKAEKYRDVWNKAIDHRTRNEFDPEKF